MTTRRLALRPSAVSLGCAGRNSPKPMTESREGEMPPLREAVHDAGGARGGQLPVRRVVRGVDRPVVGVAFHAQRVRILHQRARQRVERGIRSVGQRRHAAREQDVACGSSTSSQNSWRRTATRSAATSVLQRRSRVRRRRARAAASSDARRRAPAAHGRSRPRRASGPGPRPWPCCHRCTWLRAAARGWPSIIDCCTMDTAMSAPEPRVFSPIWIGSSVLGLAAERRAQRIRQHAELALVDRRDGVHHHEERQQQRDQVAVGNGPRFVVGVVFVFVLAAAMGTFLVF